MIISGILYFIFQLLITLIGLILTPINLLITNYLPSLNIALSAINTFLSMVSNTLAYSVSLSLLSSTALSLIVMYFTFELIFPMSVYLIKLALSWYNKLKP